MGPVGVILVAVGAVLYLGVDATVEGVHLSVIGVVLVVVGAIAILAALVDGGIRGFAGRAPEPVARRRRPDRRPEPPAPR